jgi:eukaryotic-like serine/threonine-protein kinase
MDTVAGVPLTTLRQGPCATLCSARYSDSVVALKVFPGKFDRATLAAVDRERAALAGLPTVLAVEAVERLDDGRHALRTGLCTESLADRVQRTGPLPADEVARLGHELARVLSAAHAMDIRHGAVHPGNVLYRGADALVLADFGVDLRAAFPRDPSHAVEYVAPETLRTGDVDPRTDLYGLGALLYHALTGRVPHAGRFGEPMGERMLRVLSSQVPAFERDDVPPELSTVVNSLLATDPSDRPDAMWVAEHLASPDEAFDDFAPASTTVVSPMQPPDPVTVEPDEPEPEPAVTTPTARPARRRPSSRHYAYAGAGALGLLLCVGVVTVLRSEPAALGTTPRMPPPAASLVTTSAATAGTLSLAEPIDEGNQVVLTWTSKSPLDYVVIVATRSQPDQYLLAQRNQTLTVQVDPARQYCFTVQGTDSSHVYQSRPRPLRGSVCGR